MKHFYAYGSGLFQDGNVTIHTAQGKSNGLMSMNDVVTRSQCNLTLMGDFWLPNKPNSHQNTQASNKDIGSSKSDTPSDSFPYAPLAEEQAAMYVQF